MKTRIFTEEQKALRSQYQKEWRARNPDKLLIYAGKTDDPNLNEVFRQHANQYHREWANKNPDRILYYSRKRYLECTEEQRAARSVVQHKYYLKRKEAKQNEKIN